MSVRMSEAQAKIYLGKHYTPPKKSKSAPKTPKAPSQGEVSMALQLRAHKIDFQEQFKFCPHRRWAADFRISGTQILVEVEGGTWTGGRHTRGKGYSNDCEKYNWATANGWRVIRFPTDKVKKGDALKAVIDLLRKGIV